MQLEHREMTQQVDKVKLDSKKLERKEKRKDFLSYYFQQKKIIWSILLSMYIVMNIIAVILTTYYYFVTILLYNGILMLILTAGIITLVVLERDYFWAFLSSIVLGLVPAIELIVGLAIAPLDTLNLAFVIVFLIISVGLIFVPSGLVYHLLKKENEDMKEEKKD